MTKPKFKPLGERVLVRRKKAEKESNGGILLPEQAQEAPRRGEILAVGCRRDPALAGDGTSPLSVKVGQVVLFGRYAEIPGEEDLVIIREEDLLAVLE